MKMITVQEMKMLEDAANAAGYSYAEMMQRAGSGIAEVIHSRYFSSDLHSIVGLVGGGNNGGDALVALTELSKRGWSAKAILLKARKQNDPLLLSFQAAGGALINETGLKEMTKAELLSSVLLDGVFGTGFRLTIPPDVQQLLQLVEEKWEVPQRIAVDCPSGVDCSSGQISPGTLKAGLTLCLETVKTGMLKYPAFDYCGELKVIDLGLQKFLSESNPGGQLVIDDEYVRKNLPERSNFSHKGTFGKVLIIGGSVNFTGAPTLAGRGAYAVGTGLVQAAVPEQVYNSAAGSNPELTWLILDSAGGVIADSAFETIRSNISGADCLVLGPGMGREETTRRFVHHLLFEADAPGRSTPVGFLGVENNTTNTALVPFPTVVIDADGLTLLARQKNWYEKLKLNAVMTPHPGEMSALTGLSIEEIQADREGVTSKFAQKWGQVLVLKGAITVIGGPAGETALIPVATSALAKAGMGDVLAGMIGGLIAQGVPTFPAAAVGAWLHAMAGVTAGKNMGADEAVLPSDVIRTIPGIYRMVRA